MIRPYGLLLALLLLAGCAQVAELSGGEKDELPPLLVAADPPHLSTGFTGDRITLVFNERIQLDRVRDRLLVSPPLGTPPVVRLSGARSVVIDLTSSLRGNTTYSFNIGEAVRDLTEGNAAVGLTHVISTGDMVDSLHIAGRVINAFSGMPEQAALVMVYDVNDTATFRTSRPAFATRTGPDGLFDLRYLRDGNYRLYALRDQNANYRYDLPNEEIAFLDSTVQPEEPDTIVTANELRMFREVSPTQQVREARVLPDGAFQILLERPADTVGVVDLARTGGILDWLPDWSRGRDTLLLWPSDTTSLQLGRYQIRTEDGIVDTLRYRRVQKMPFFNALEAVLQELPDGPRIRIRSARPILSTDSTRFSLVRDSISLPFSLAPDTQDLRVIHMSAAMEPGDRAVLQILPNGVIDIYGGHNDTLSTGLGRAAEQSNGTFRVRLDVPEDEAGPFLIQLVSRQGNLIRQAAITDPDDPIVWERLPPGVVDLRLIDDRNGNGRWDPGSLDDEVQPERVWRYPESVNVRASWDLGVDWKITARAPVEEVEEDPEP